MRTNHKPLELLFITLALLVPGQAVAELKVVTTIPDLKAIVAEVGGAHVSAESIAKGTQDPHHLEAKPSFMVKVSRADLVVSIGMDLEAAWLPNILQGGRNPRVMLGQPGYLEVGPSLDPLEVPKGEVTRAQGDVHPSGNPHVWLDPVRFAQAGQLVAARLGELDPPNAAKYAASAKALEKRMLEKAKGWKSRIDASGVRQVVTHHRTLSYFLARFGIASAAILEPKPGIPPTSGHILEVIRTIRDKKVPLVMIENYFDANVANRIKQDLPAVRVSAVPVSVEGAPEVKTIDDLYETLVRTIEGKP
jgi:zinc/manganese transport system substrate-binding protein